MSDPVSAFYDTLSSHYHLIFKDWQESVQRQGMVLDKLLRRHLGRQNGRVLDCSCGIGTQAIGLALRDWTVTGTDLSAEAVARAPGSRTVWRADRFRSGRFPRTGSGCARPV
jgi:2-polyprenyl-3-methyl-5-hydroxy-6-metoxy-1,4-benzoquinol methylase